jgi:hypothetical protein
MPGCRELREPLLGRHVSNNICRRKAVTFSCSFTMVAAMYAFWPTLPELDHRDMRGVCNSSISNEMRDATYSSAASFTVPISQSKLLDIAYK